MTADLAFLGTIPAPPLDTTAQHDTVRLMRERSGLTQTAAAKALGYTPQWESKVESGKIPLRGRDLARMAAILDIPAGFLTKPSAQGLGVGTHFLSYRIPNKIRAQALAEANFTSTILGHFLGHLTDSPVLLLPRFDAADYGKTARLAGQAIAWEMRQFWGQPDGPLQDLAGCFERSGGFIRLTDSLPEGIQSVHTKPGWDHPAVILIDRALPSDLQLFALAHEIGHLVMDYGDAASTTQDCADSEARADKFARELLMPLSEVGDDLSTLTPGKLDSLGRLQATWGLPLREIVDSALHAGYISDAQSRRWIQVLNTAITGEVAPSVNAMRPTAIQKLLGEAYMGRGGWTLPEMAEDAEVKEGHLMALLGLDCTVPWGEEAQSRQTWTASGVGELPAEPSGLTAV